MNNYDPNTYDDEPEVNPRIRNLRFALVGVIVVTVPFYLVGIVILVLAGNSNNGRGTEPTEVIITPSPIGGELTETPTLRPTGTLSSSPTARSDIGPTPFQFVPPTRTPPPTDEIIIIPTDTPFPSLTPLPQATQAPPTNTPLPTIAPPTDTLLPPEPTSPPAEPNDPPAEPNDPPAEPDVSESGEEESGEAQQEQTNE